MQRILIVLARNIHTGEVRKIIGGKAVEDAGFTLPSVHKCLRGALEVHRGHTFTRGHLD